MRTWWVWLAVGGMAAGAPAGPVRPSDIPAEAKWWAHCDVEQFKQTAVGRTFLEMLGEPDVARKLDALKAVFNFDLRTDLDGITACGAGRRSAVIARGRFDESRLLTLLKAGDGYQELVVDGRTIHSWLDEGKVQKQGREKARMYGAIHRSGAAVLSEQAETAAHVLKVLDGEAAGLPDAAVPSHDTAAVLIARMSADAVPAEQAEHPVPRGVKAAALAIAERGTNVEARLNMTLRDAATVTQIRQIVDGLRAAALLNSEKDPRAARLAEQVSVRAEEDRLEMSLSLPVAEITAAMRAELEKKRATAPAPSP